MKGKFAFCKKRETPSEEKLPLQPIPQNTQPFRPQNKKLSKKVIVFSVLGISLFWAFFIIVIPNGPELYYDNIVSSIKNERYIDAQERINKFLIEYPDSEYVDEVKGYLSIVIIEVGKIKVAEEAEKLSRKEAVEKEGIEKTQAEIFETTKNENTSSQSLNAGDITDTTKVIETTTLTGNAVSLIEIIWVGSTGLSDDLKEELPINGKRFIRFTVEPHTVTEDDFEIVIDNKDIADISIAYVAFFPDLVLQVNIIGKEYGTTKFYVRSLNSNVVSETITVVVRKWN